MITGNAPSVSSDAECLRKPPDMTHPGMGAVHLLSQCCLSKQKQATCGVGGSRMAHDGTPEGIILRSAMCKAILGVNHVIGRNCSMDASQGHYRLVANGVAQGNREQETMEHGITLTPLVSVVKTKR